MSPQSEYFSLGLLQACSRPHLAVQQRVATIFQMNDMISVFILALIKTVPFNNHR